VCLCLWRRDDDDDDDEEGLSSEKRALCIFRVFRPKREIQNERKQQKNFSHIREFRERERSKKKKKKKNKDKEYER
jgi:hypothetical protein